MSISKRYKKLVILLFIVFLAFILRFWHLGEVPTGLSWDEVSNGYNAYSLLKTGRDEYGTFLPLSIRAYGDYNPPLSVYLLIPSIFFFGLSEFAVRFPSAFFGSLTIPLTFFLTRSLFKRDEVSLLSAFFLSVSPWHLQFSRYDHEATFALFFILLAILLFLKFRQNSPIFLFASFFFFALAFYSYQGSKFWVFLIILALLIAYFKEIYRTKKIFLWGVVFFLIFLLPFIFDIQKSLIRTQSVGILSKAQPAPQLLTTFLDNYTSHFSFDFLFFKGDQIGRHSVRKIGELYLFELPFVVLGLIYLVQNKLTNRSFFFLWFFFSPVAASLAQPNPHALRSLIFLPTWQVLTSFGIVVFLLWIKKKFYSPGFLLGCLILAGTVVYSFLLYRHIYYIHYPKDTAPDWQDGYRELFFYLKPQLSEYEEIAISNYYAKSYIYTLFYLGFDPQSYHRLEKRVDGFDQFTFFGPSWQKRVPGKALLVTPPWQATAPKILRAVYASSGDLVFNISEQE